MEIVKHSQWYYTVTVYYVQISKQHSVLYINLDLTAADADITQPKSYRALTAIQYVIGIAWQGVLYGLYSHDSPEGLCINQIARTCHAICVVYP